LPLLRSYPRLRLALMASTTGLAKAPNHINGAMYVCGATSATNVAATKTAVAKAGATSLSGSPRGKAAKNHSSAFNVAMAAM